ncbi:MAG: hypothetical protein ACE5GG_00735 [Candidatus Omnitrophota bacterium]
MPHKRKVKIRIGQLLLEKKIIDSKQLQEALNLQRMEHRNDMLGEILVELGYVSKKDIYSVLATQSGYPYIRVNHCVIDQDALGLIPRNIVEDSHVIPIDRIDGILTVAMLNPLDKQTVEAIERITGLRVKIFLATAGDMEQALKINYGNK